MAILEDIYAEIQRSNVLLEDLVAKVAQIITIIAVPANAPPQYTGPTLLNDLVVGSGYALEGFDPDGDPITWSIDEQDAAKASVTPAGVLTPLIPLDEVAVTIYLDDGKA